MKKSITPSYSDAKRNKIENVHKLEPTKKTIDNILKYASTRRVEKIGKNVYIEFNLN